MNTGDWTAAGSCATAIMAIATFLLARHTRETLEETKKVATATEEQALAVREQSQHVERQVEISTAALRASVQPWLIWEAAIEAEGSASSPFAELPGGAIGSSGWHSAVAAYVSEREVSGWLRLRNVGSGLALLDMSSSRIYPRNEVHPYEDLRPDVEVPIVPSGAVLDVNFTIPARNSVDGEAMTMLEFAGGGAGHELFAIEIVYRDALGESEVAARFAVHRGQGEDEWQVFRVEYRRRGDEMPVVVSRYG
jgi:hypothetical protein